MSGGSWQDRPPEGSIAASLLTTATIAPEASAASIGEGADVTPTADSAEAIEGVTVERCAYVEAALSEAGIPPAEYDGYAAQHLGVPAGRWGTIRAGWESRQRTDWRVGAAYGDAFEAARKELRKKR